MCVCVVCAAVTPGGGLRALRQRGVNASINHLVVRNKSKLNDTLCGCVSTSQHIPPLSSASAAATASVPFHARARKSWSSKHRAPKSARILQFHDRHNDDNRPTSDAINLPILPSDLVCLCINKQNPSATHPPHHCHRLRAVP